MMDSVIFDLDGTLWDTSETCAIGWNNVIRRLGVSFRHITVEDIQAITGLPHEDCVRRVFVDVPEHQIASLVEQTAIEDVRLLREMGGNLYEGVRDGLQRLTARMPLFIVSNCQAGYIDAFLDSSGLRQCFRDCECWGNTGLTKAQNLARIIERNGLLSPIFVGDTVGDQSAAHQCGVPFVHVGWGFGRCEGVTPSFSSFDVLTAWLLRDVSQAL